MDQKRVLGKFEILLHELAERGEEIVLNYNREEHTEEMNLAFDALIAMAEE